MKKSEKYIGLVKTLAFDITVWLCMAINVVYTHTQIMHTSIKGVIYPTSHLSCLFLEVFMIWLFSVLFRSRKNYVLLVLFLLSTLVRWINVGYSRYFDTYMPLSLYTEFNNLNGLSANIQEAIRWSDILFVVTSILVIVAFLLTIKRRNSPYPYLKSLLVVIIAALTLEAGGMYKEYLRHRDILLELNYALNFWDYYEYRVKSVRDDKFKIRSFYYGIEANLLLDYIRKYNRKEYSPAEREYLAKYMYASRYEAPVVPNSNNLILILIESFSSYPIQKVFNGVEITPTINKLIASSYYASEMTSQALSGVSSDGQYTYLSGLLPCKDVVTINEICHDSVATFVSLMKKQNPGLWTQMIIPTEESFWSQSDMCVKYGIEKLYSQEVYKVKKDEWLTDKELFEFADSLDHGLHEPFVSIVLTSSMHDPYTYSIEDYGIQYPSVFSAELKNYLNRVHYMDKYLGRYIQSLKDKNLYDHSTIILLADHKPPTNQLNMKDEEIYAKLPLIIVNPPKGYEGFRNQEVIAQSSVFPTLLDLYGIESSWRGVGKSVFMPDSIVSSEYEQQRSLLEQDISDYILFDKYMR